MEKEIKLITGGLSIDDRGSVSYVNDFNFNDVKRFYQVDNHKNGFIRAWHGHRNEGKYVFVSSGTALIGVVNMDTEDIKTFVLSSKQPKILYIPPNHYNGFKTLEDNTKIMFFSTSTLQESLSDDERKNFDHWDIWNEDYR